MSRPEARQLPVLRSSGSGGSLEGTPTPRAWNSRKGQRSTCLRLSQKKSQKGKWGKGPQDKEELNW